MDLQQQIRRCRFAAVDPVGSRYHQLLQQQQANAGSATLSVYVIAFAFSALTLLDRLQEEHLACKNRVMRCWCLERSADRLHVVRLMPLHPQTPVISCLIYIQTGFTFLVTAYLVCPTLSDCLEAKELRQSELRCAVLYMTVVHSDMHTNVSSL